MRFSNALECVRKLGYTTGLAETFYNSGKKNPTCSWCRDEWSV